MSDITQSQCKSTTHRLRSGKRSWEIKAYFPKAVIGTWWGKLAVASTQSPTTRPWEAPKFWAMLLLPYFSLDGHLQLVAPFGAVSQGGQSQRPPLLP